MAEMGSLFMYIGVNLILLFALSAAAELVCNENEVVDTCPSSCKNDFCPTSENVEICSITDPTPDSCGPPVCRCRFNYKRSNDNGTCIPTRDCPPFDCSARPNEEYNSCPSICPSDDCSQASLSGRCPFGRIGIILECNPKCRCIQGYWRDNGICVPFAECPGICKENEEFSSCIQTAVCGRENCTQINQPINCPVIVDGSCQEGCVCVQGYLRAENGSCIPEDQCPGPICGQNERLNECTNGCDNDACPNNLLEENNCIAPAVCLPPQCQCIRNYRRDDRGICVPIEDCEQNICGVNEKLTECINTCNTDACPKNMSGENEGACEEVCGPPRCVCTPNYRRDDNGNCIPIQDCPEICPNNEEFSSCTQALCRAQSCSQKGQPIACPRIPQGSCQQGCVCVPGTLRDENGNCIPEYQCPGQICGVNEQLMECTSVCKNDSCPINLNNDIEVPCITICGPPKCECIPSYKRDENGDCIPIENCPEICPFNEVYSSCTQASCRPQNCYQIGQPITCPGVDIVDDGSCQQGCLCVPGTLRDENGNCIPEYQCPGQICGVNEQLMECTSVCKNDSCPINLNNDIEVPCITICGPTKCECIPSYKRDENGDCIPIENCPEICPFNEVYSSCIQASCRPQYCNQIGQPITCPGVDIVDDGSCQQGCLCVPGTLRDENGNCITEDQCPGQICGVNEQLIECTNVCNNDSCPKNLNNDIEVPCIKICGPPKCECIPSYKRDENGDCIPIENCPEICPFNEVYSSCIQASCRPQNCTQIGQPITCPGVDIVDDGSCQQGCLCVPGTLRDENGNCITEDQCPGQICGVNEQLIECTNVCNNDSCPKNLNNDIEVPCIKICGPPKCECIPSYKRDENGDCIPIENCPEICPFNEVYSSCIQASCRPQNCTQIGQPITCPGVDIVDGGSCQQGCLCVPGTLRDENGNCIPEDQCLGQICGVNEQFNLCPSVCNSDVCPKFLNNEEEDACVDVCGPPKCECISNFKRNDNNECIPIENCPEICPFNEVYSSCIQAPCRPQNCTQIGQPITCPGVDIVDGGSCQQGCLCVPGTLRDENGNCIPEDQCLGQICGVNEQFNLCPSVCNSDVCPKFLNNEEEDACVDVCGPPKCECITNFKRNDNNECIPIEDCPEICPFNEVYSSCTQASCRPQNCTQIGQPITCPGADILDDESCQQGCVCVLGTLRDALGNCIPEEECSRQMCGINEQLTQCSSVCNTDACPKNLNNKDDEECFDFCGPPKCECIPNYKRDDNEKCIPIEDCPEICPFNEVYSSCPQASCRPQNCTQIGQPITCPGADIIDDESCQQGCVCVPGSLRDANGNCIPEEQCPEIPSQLITIVPETGGSINRGQLQCNAPNEVLSCVPECPPERTCRNRDIRFNCLQESIERCQQKCVCKEGYFRNAIGECITGKECDQCKGENEYFSCGPACDNVCADLAFQNKTNCPIINIQCNRKCYCEDGYARDDNQICVPIEQCPKPKCADPNEEYSDCRKTCPPDLCFSLVARFKCPGPERVKCEPGCSCKPGFLRQKNNTTCVPICECSELVNSPDCINA